MSERHSGKRPRFATGIVEYAGDWSWVSCAAELIESAVAEVAAEPGLGRGRSDVAIVLSSDAEVEKLNKRYRGKAKPTNVLSFPPGPGSPPEHIGDIVLASETIRREADEQDIPAEHHLQHLVVHGMLHLLGFDHETDSDAERMESLETKILARLGVADPYTDPTELIKRT